MSRHAVPTALALILFLGATGCASPDKAAPTTSEGTSKLPSDAERGTPVPFEPLETFGDAAIVVPRQARVISTEADWTELWHDLYQSRIPIPAVPAVDFTKNNVVVVVMGRRPSGGFATEIDAITGNGTMKVTVIETSPGQDCGTTQALTNPFAVATVPKGSESADFVYEKVTHSCEG